MRPTGVKGVGDFAKPEDPADEALADAPGGEDMIKSLMLSRSAVSSDANLLLSTIK